MEVTATRDRELAIIAVVVFLAGWVVSVGIRSWRGGDVNVVLEMTGVATACGVLWRALTGRRNDGGNEP